MTSSAIGHLDEPGTGPHRPGLLKVRGWVVGIGTPVLRVRALVDGRDVLDPGPFVAAGVRLRRIGRP